jgi:hypothetical protein
MQKKLIPLLALLFSLMLTTSCLKEKTEYLPLGEVKLHKFENLANDPRLLFFVFETTNNYECLNYPIRYENSTSTGNIDVRLIDIEKTDFCLTAIGPATAEVNLGNYQTGSYPVKITIGNVENSGTLHVTNAQYILYLNSPQMMTIASDTLNRIPDSFIWGYAASSDTTDFPIVEAFLDSLENIGAAPVSIMQGEYGYFKIDQENEIEPLEVSNWSHSINFYYKFDESEAVLKDLVYHYYLSYYPKMFAYIRTSDGGIISSLQQ